MVAEGAFCVGLGLADRENRAFVRQKGVQSHSLGNTLLRLFYNRVGALTVEINGNAWITLYATYLKEIRK